MKLETEALVLERVLDPDETVDQARSGVRESGIYRWVAATASARSGAEVIVNDPGVQPSGSAGQR